MNSATSYLPKFSVIIPTYNRRESLERVLRGLAAQQYPPGGFEVIVVCDGETDGSEEMVRSLRVPFELRVLTQTNQGAGAARNLGVDAARHPYLLFLDDDVVPCPELVGAHARAHGDASARAVIGTMLETPQMRSPWVRWEAAELSRQYAAMQAGEWAPTPWQFYTGNASIKGEHVRRAGGFDPAFRRAEDIELGFRLAGIGVEFVFEPRAQGMHIADRSFRSWLDAARQYGRNDVLLGHLDERVVGLLPHRHRMTRALLRIGVGRTRLAAAVHAAGHLAAWCFQAAHLRRLSYAACGAVFNLSYWEGVLDIHGFRDTRRLLDG